MRIILAIAWLFVGLGGLIFHLGPGEKKMELDNISSLLGEARQHVEKEQWGSAVLKFDEALAALPHDRQQEQFIIRLEKAKAQMMCSQLPDARQALQGLLDEVEASSDCSDSLKADVRAALASSQYYMTWLMRLEGLAKDEWEPEIESARQHYRVLAERADDIQDQELKELRLEDLESAIRLARMDLKDLQGLPLPSQ